MLGGSTRFRVLAALVGAIVFFITSPFPKANALTSDEGQLVSLTNGARSSRGISRLSLSSDLNAAARRHSNRMASRGAIFHNTSVTSEVSGWRLIAENVGRGGSARSVHNAFMGSSSHRTHILDGRYNQFGVGAVWAGSGSSRRLYVTEIFVLRGSSRAPVVRRSSSPVRRHASVPRRRPRPAARPAPALPPPALTIDFLLEFVKMDAADVSRLDLLAAGPSLRAR